jgi:hypothetical protein
MAERNAVTGQKGLGQNPVETKFGGVIAPILDLVEMAQICAINSQGFAHHTDVANYVFVLLAGKVSNLPTRHGDRIAWSDDRVHNGPSSVCVVKKPV